ncbi:hypothetical protein [Mesorhizobium sp. ES1-6]|uniref:hypothetical protein n=1 Tax=Mesorhizobium sp. ES1-6 TaxID=2876626 RepID=UPI001CCCE323|nr:hypothetical protein [Mesorhizobium sp. ES1-6]MBZ9801080.1 hypothetical protein [Mesorhizobium sp. ES1-6]
MNIVDGEPQSDLVPDVGSPLTLVAIQLPRALLEGKWKEGALGACEELVKCLATVTDIDVLADRDNPKLAQDWVTRVAPKGRFAMIPATDEKLNAIWIRDPFLCKERGNHRTYVKTGSHPQEARQADWLAAVDGSTIASLKVVLDGGDCLVGQDYWLAGVQAVHETVRINKITYLDACMAISKIDRRRLHIAGYRARDLKSRLYWILVEARKRAKKYLAVQPLQAWTDTNIISPYIRIILEMIYILRHPEELLQPWAHIDLVLALTGIKDETTGKPIVLVANPTLAPSCPVDGAAHTQNDPLDALEVYLKEIGYCVRRNPAPFSGPKGDARRLFPYNNVIVSNDPDIVWLPQFALADGTFADADAANVEIWRQLGFKVIPVPGWCAFLLSDGAIRCATKTLVRGAATQKSD